MTSEQLTLLQSRLLDFKVRLSNNYSSKLKTLVPYFYTLKDNKIEISFSITIEDEGENNLIKDIEPKKSID